MAILTEYCNYRQSKLVYLWELPNDETLIENPTIAAHYVNSVGFINKAVVGLESLPHAQKCQVSVLVSPTQPTTPTELEP